MADSVIGSLRVLLGLDTAAFTSGTKQATSTLNQFVSGFKKAVGGLAIGGVATAFVVGIKRAIDAADEMGKASEKFGVPVEQLSRLKYAAELNEVSFESLGKGLKKFAATTQEALSDPTGKAAKQLAQLGISIDDIRTKNTEELFSKAADGTTRFADGLGKADAIGNVFGKRIGVDLIPLLNKGSAGIREAGDEAEKLGIIISTKTALAADKFNDEMQAIEKFVPGVFQKIAAAALPALTSIATQFKTAGLEGGFLKFAIDELVKFVQEAIFEFNKLVYIIGQVAVAWEHLQALFSDKRTFEEMVTAQRGIADAISNVWSAGEKVKRQMVWNEFAHSIEMTTLSVERFGKAFLEQAGPAVTKAGESLDKYIESVKKHTAATLADAATVGQSAGAHAFLKTTLEGLAIAEANGGKISRERAVALIEAANAAGMAAEKLRVNQIIQESLPEWQKLQDKITDIQMLMDLFPEKAEQLKDALFKTQTDINTMALAAAGAVLGGISQVFMAFGQHNKKLFEIGKAFAIAEATVNTFKAANQALTAPPGPPLSYAYVAAAVATGIANVVKITQTKYTGMATGGSLMVGGAGGIDSKMIPIMASPGEKISVDQNKYGESGSSRTVTVQGLNSKDYYRGDVLRDFVENLNEAMADGLKLKVV